MIKLSDFYEADKHKWTFLDNFPEFEGNIFPWQKKYIQQCTNYLSQSWYYQKVLSDRWIEPTNENIKKELIKQSHSLSVGYRLAKTLFASIWVDERLFEIYTTKVFEACFILAKKENIFLWPSILNFAILSPLDWNTENIDLYRVFNEYFATLWQSKNRDLELGFEEFIKFLAKKTEWKKWVRWENLSLNEQKIQDLKCSLQVERDFAMRIWNFYAKKLLNIWNISQDDKTFQELQNIDLEQLEKTLIQWEEKKLKILWAKNNENSEYFLLKWQKIFFEFVSQAIWQGWYFQNKYNIFDSINIQTKNEIISELNPILLAYAFVKQAYREKYRKSGERFFEHFKWVIEDYIKVSNLTWEAISPKWILLRLLHDIKEDNLIDTKSLANIFWADIAFQVDSLSKKSYSEYIEKADIDSKEYFEFASKNKDSESFEKKTKSDFLMNLVKNYRDNQYFWKYENIWENKKEIKINLEIFFAKLDDRINNLTTLQQVWAESQINQIWQTIKYFYPAFDNYIKYFEQKKLNSEDEYFLQVLYIRFAIFHFLIKFLLNIFLSPKHLLNYWKSKSAYKKLFEKISHQNQNFSLSDESLKKTDIFKIQSTRIEEILDIIDFYWEKEFFETEIWKNFLLWEQALYSLSSEKIDQIKNFVKGLMYYRNVSYKENKKS